MIPDEICSRCGKIISRQSRANIVDEEIVCTPCVGAIENEKSKRHLATERQIAYASSLHLRIIPGESSEDISKRISKSLLDIQLRRASAEGVDTKGLTDATQLDEWIGDVLHARCWLWSVMRHMKGGNWLIRAHTKIPIDSVNQIAYAIASNSALMELIWEQEEGTPPDRHVDLEDQLSTEGLTADRWFYFGREGASSRSKAFSETKVLVEAHLLVALQNAPKTITYTFSNQ